MGQEIRRVTIVGAGLMGHGIAQVFAVAGYDVVLVARTEQKFQAALGNMRANLSMLSEIKGLPLDQLQPALKNVAPAFSIKEGTVDTDLVIEAVGEDVLVKMDVFQELDATSPARTILSTTTSTIMPSKVAAVTTRPDRVIGAHFVNPPYLVPLVEVVMTPDTSEDTVDTVLSVLKTAGKKPVLLRKEMPGFVINRLQAALLREALWIVSENAASPADVDFAIQHSIGPRWAAAGVFGAFELAGWDVVLAVMDNLVNEISSSVEIPVYLREKVRKGELGAKTSKGFYEWTPDSVAALKRRIAQALVRG